jgi:two-component system, cell cycle sensor histidine kinase and response regulator CckA
MTQPSQPPAVLSDQRTIVAALPDATLITRDCWENRGVEILYANPAFCRLTGYSLEELIGQNTRLLHGARTDLPLLASGLEAHQTSGEAWLNRKDGTPFFARWNFAPLDAGQLVAVYRDEAEIRRLRDALLESSKLDTVGRLASGVAHDFNQLLSVINGYCEIMSRKLAAQPEVSKDLDEIHRAGLKASAIARQILEFSRRHETEVKVVNYNSLIREIAEILRRVAGTAVELELRLASDLANTRIDPTQFQQVLLNLCFNAHEAMPRGGKLSVSTYNYQAPAADRRVAEMKEGKFYAALRVADTGQGVDPTMLKQIFEPFFTTKPHGTGLGLATVASLVRQYDGHVTVQSAPGQGTAFEVFLPETPELEETAPAKPGGRPATRGSETVLLIQSDDVLGKMISGILVVDGYAVTRVETAEQARAAGQLRPQLVVAHCADKASVTLVRKVYANNPTLKLILVSAESPGVQFPEFPPAATAHLPLPFALSTLMLTVRRLLDGGR